MTSTGPTGRDPFMPKAPRVRGRAITLAVVAHVLLLLGLALGVNWRSEEPASVAAELWSATPQAAAPRAVEPPPTAPTVTPKTEPPAPKPPAPEPAPKPIPRPEPALAKPPPAALPDPQIAIEKARREEARRVALAEEAQKRERREREQAERDKVEKAERAKAERDRQALARKEADRKAEQARAEQAKAAQAKAEQQRAEQLKAEKAEKADAARLAALRDAQMKRIAGMAGATGAPTDTGTAARSSAPSANYAGRVAARVKPNIVFTDSVDGNPRAVVEVKLAPDGTIIAKRLVQSSGAKAWDDAVLRAVERTEMLPLDNGRAPPVFEIGFRPRD